MATAAAVAKVKELTYLWEGKDKSGKIIKGQMRAGGQAVVQVTLRRQGIVVTKVHRQKLGRGGKVSDKDVTLFTRQMATMMKAGVPLLQSFDIVGKGHANPAVARLLMGIKTDVETGASLAAAFRKYPLHFDALFCNLVAAGEQAGILETLLERLATYKEKILGIKSKIKSALFYPIAIIVVAFIITAVIMIFVIPAFKEVFMDRLMLKVPVFGDLIKKSTIARWTRTLSIMFAAGVPLVEALVSVGGASGNYVYAVATKEIQRKVSTGTSLTASMQESNVFPNMVVQMVSIGEESGALESMLGKVADFFEAEVDDAVDALTSLMEPMIMVVLGVLIGGMVIAMYLPIFKIGQAV